MNDNEIANLIISIRANAENLEAVANEAVAKLQGIGKAADKTRTPLKNAGQAGKAAGTQMAAGAREAQMAWIALAVAAVAALRKIDSAIDQSVKTSNAYYDSLRGLSSVAEYVGVSSTQLAEASAKVTNQFINQTAAATALKNLLLRGYSLDQAVKTIQNLSNAAAYGRQASLTLSQAVTSATEGLKNENSILVDNAGVTKNVSKMWEEYAKARGLSVAAMTQAQKVEAEYLGIQQETAAMTGDLVSLQDTLSGKMAATKNQVYQLSVAFGNDYAAVKSLEQDAYKALLEMLTELTKALPGVATGAVTATEAFLGIVVLVPSIQKVVTLLKSLRVALAGIGMSFGTVGLIALGIGTIAGAYTAIKTAIDDTAAAEEARIQKNREAVTAEEGRRETLKGLLNTYVELKKKTDLSYTEAFNLVSIEEKLATQYGITKEALDKLVNSTDDYATSLNGVVNAATSKELLAKKEQQAADSFKTARQTMYDAINNMPKIDGKHYNGPLMDLGYFEPISDEEYKEQLNAAFTTVNQLISDELEVTKQKAENDGNVFSDEISQILTAALIPKIDLTQFDDADVLIGFFEGLASHIGALASDVGSSEAFEGLQEFSAGIMAGVVPSDEAIEEAMQIWFALLGPDSPIHEYLSALVESGVLTVEQFDEAMMQLASAADPLGIIGESFEGTKERAAEAAASFSNAVNEAKEKLEEYQKTLTAVQKNMKSTTALTEQVKEWRDLYNAYQNAKAGAGDVEKAIKALTPAAKKMIAGFDGSADAIEEANAMFERFASYIPEQITNAQNSIIALEQQLAELDAMEPYVGIEGDSAILQAAINAAYEQLAELIRLAQAYGIDIGGLTGSKGGGGGGRSAPAATASAGITKSAYETSIEQIEHLKALDQLTYEQELRNLEDIAARRIADAEERLDLEERIYDVKKAIAERDAENLTELSEAMITALEERYDAMRENELSTLNTSKDAWEEWRDHNVSAIQDQIDALNELAEAEDRESDKEEYLRKIAKLEQSLAYEQDNYNQAQIQKQLDAAKNAYSEWLSDMEREDQIAALEKQMEAINDTADAEIDSLDKQRREIEAYYADRMGRANLQAEAELELINSTQQEIIDLLTEYAPEYDAAGRTLGERLMDGFTSVVGTFNDWFSGFEAQITSAVNRMQAANVTAAAARAQTYDENGNPVSGITFRNEYNFNTPVETPAETARRIQQANEDLAEQIAGE